MTDFHFCVKKAKKVNLNNAHIWYDLTAGFAKVCENVGIQYLLDIQRRL